MIRVYDCRFEKKDVSKKTLSTKGLDLKGFLRLIHQEFAIPLRERFFLVTTDRTVVDYDKFKKLEDGSTLYVLRHKGQTLSAATEEDIKFVPHFNTLVESGSYEYFAEGRKSLPCALAELVDNALSATSKISGTRKIEIRMLFDKTLGKPAVIVLDNGCGMTSKQLNNWAVYRLSKFTRESGKFESEKEEYVRPAAVPRSLNSDISFFGVGGKRAVFHIGDSVRMISKPVGSPDVHELILSKEEFKKKEHNKEDVYRGTILNRKPGDFSHVIEDERFLHSVIAEELGKESFTAVVITGVCPDHIDYLKTHFDEWTRELAHIYHYYIHGVNGNNKRSNVKKSDQLPKIDILVTLWEKPTKSPCAMNLREVDNDMQTLYIKATHNTFEFSATPSDGGTVEGVLRYHPFLYDSETYPKDPFAAQAPVDEEEYETESGIQNQARGRRDIFECFWNGRLIPYTTVSEFDWCTRPVKGPTLPAECYSRFSGALFTDDRFQVNASKLKFMDLELKLKSKDTIFTPIANTQKTSKRGNIQKEFTQWLQTCHEKLDKQVQFIGYTGTITWIDAPTKKIQYPWATFSSIELDGKIFKTGQVVKSMKTQPIYYGSIIRFLLYGCHDEDVYATGGHVEIKREPEALYDTATKILAISKLDRTATDKTIKTAIENDIDKLPEKLKLVWPEENVWAQNAAFPAGTPFGPLKVEIVNRKGLSVSSRINTGGHGGGIKLNIEFRIVHHGPKGDKDVVKLVAPFVTNVGHWFKKIETLTNLGKYTLTLKTVLCDTGATVYGGRQLPSYVLKFTIKEGNAENFTLNAVSSTVRVGIPFNIPLQFKDYYNHPTTPPPNLKPVLKCSGLELTYESVSCSGTTFTIKGVKARGKVQDYQQSKSYDLNVTLPGLKKEPQTIKINLFPGNPHSLDVKPDSNPVKVENGTSTTFTVEVHDVAGNLTANPKQLVRCQNLTVVLPFYLEFQASGSMETQLFALAKKITGLPMVVADCSSTGAGQLVTKPINLNIINGEPQILEAQFIIPSQKHVEPVVRALKVMPSSRVAQMGVFCRGEEMLVLKNNEKIMWQAGGLLENLFYKLYDESGEEVTVTVEMASCIKVNWTADDYQADLNQGRLPDVLVPKQVKDERFYQVSYQDLSVSFCFTIVPCPGEPARLKATLPQSTLKLGEKLAGYIKLELMDQYDNVTKRLTPACVHSVTVEAEGLDSSKITYRWQESSSSILVSGLRFLSGSLGPREVSFSYSDFTEHSIIKLTAGVPSQLKLISGPEQPLQILNGQGIPTPFLVQLCDEWGNPSPDQRVVVEIKPSPATLKLSTAYISKPVDAEGKASFTVNSVSGLKGYYQLVFKGSFNRKPIPGPSVNLTVIPDPNKPVRLQVDYDAPAGFIAGETFPVFSVTVVSDQGSPIMTFNPAALSMLLWEGVSSTPPQSVTELKCSKPIENEKKDCFHFRDKLIPERVGKYTIQFSLLIDKKEILLSKQLSINVEANQPVKLGPVSQPTTPVVSYSTNISSRTLVEDLTLKIMDKFGNPAGQNLSGNVVVSIRCPDGEKRRRKLPLFADKTSSFQIILEEGSAHITNLAIMEHSPGENGSRYILVFRPEGPLLPTTLTPFELPFHFYNDADNQKIMSQLSRRRDELKDAIKRVDTRCSTYSHLRQALTTRLLDMTTKESTLRNELNRKNVTIPHPLPSHDITKLLENKQIEAQHIERSPRRECVILNTFIGPDVLGMVGHLALILDDDAARVISWHLAGDMDCIITRTTAEAKRIYRDTRGHQQVMALDSILVQQGERPLPHIRNGRPLFDAPGNPIYAKDLLFHPYEPENCQMVFKNVLGNTILMDDLDSATNYRKQVVGNRMQCPTILTRQGDRISARGKFGGAQNKAPPIARLRVFGAPLPHHYNTLMEQIDLLSQYLTTVSKKENLEQERNDYIEKGNLPEMHQRMEEAKKEIAEIDRKLASVSLAKRGPEEAGESSGILTKRPKRNSRHSSAMY